MVYKWYKGTRNSSWKEVVSRLLFNQLLWIRIVTTMECHPTRKTTQTTDFSPLDWPLEVERQQHLWVCDSRNCFYCIKSMEWIVDGFLLEQHPIFRRLPSRELTYPTEREKENHLQNAIFGGYVSSLEGMVKMVFFSDLWLLHDQQPEEPKVQNTSPGLRHVIFAGPSDLLNLRLGLRILSW